MTCCLLTTALEPDTFHHRRPSCSVRDVVGPVTNVLTERADSPQEAARKIARLETAHHIYLNTPEAF